MAVLVKKSSKQHLKTHLKLNQRQKPKKKIEKMLRVLLAVEVLFVCCSAVAIEKSQEMQKVYQRCLTEEKAMTAD